MTLGRQERESSRQKFRFHVAVKFTVEVDEDTLRAHDVTPEELDEMGSWEVADLVTEFDAFAVAQQYQSDTEVEDVEAFIVTEKESA